MYAKGIVFAQFSVFPSCSIVFICSGPGPCEQYWAAGLRGSVVNYGLCAVLRLETPETRLVSEGGETTSLLIA